MTITINGSGTITGATTMASATSFSADVTLGGSGVEILNNSGRIVLGQSGSVLQVLQTVKTDAFSTASATMVDITGLSVSITPSSTSSKVLVFVNMWLSGGTAASAVYYNLVRGATNLGVSTAGSSYNSTGSIYISATTANTFVGNSITYLDSPATTSSTTYKIQLASGTGSDTVYINRRTGDAVIGGTSVITVMEIAG